jgi:hypothetical protein
MNDGALPDHWGDPEFSDLSGRGKAGKPPSPGPRLRAGAVRGPAWILALFLAVLCVDCLFDPTLGPLILGLVAAVGMGLGVMAGAMALGTVGYGLFAAGDRVVTWLRRGTRWDDD